MTGWPSIATAAAPAQAANRAALAEPAAQQARWLTELLCRNADTEYGRRHRFASIHSIADYVGCVPIVRYQDLAPEIDAIADGAANILTSDSVVAFEETSGSTSGRKLIPYTRSGLQDFESAALVWLQQLAESHSAITTGKAYWSISPIGRLPRRTAGGLSIGFASDAGYFSNETALSLASLSAVPLGAGQIPDMDAWRFFTLRSLLACEELTFISVWSPTFLSLLLDALPARADQFLAAIHNGKAGCDLPPELTGGFKPQPERARKLAAALRSSDLTAIWPRLALVSAWSHGAARGPFEALRDRLPSVAFDGKGLMATEGIVSISHPRHARPLPAIAWSLIEFIGDDGCSYLAHQLEANAIYRIVITNRNGFYRYDLGDRVLCWQTKGGVPELAFLGRADLVCDMVGEKLDEVFVTACLGQIHTHGLLAPVDAPYPHYELLQDADRPSADTDVLEGALDANPHYAYARRLGQLGPIRLRRCHDLKGAYHRYRQRQGQRLGDIKPPVMLRTPADTAAFLTFLRTDSEPAARRIA
jgi:hypothetical protein